MKDWEKNVQEIRKRIFLAGYTGGNAHFASAFSCVEILYALYLNGVMKHDPQNPQWPQRDRFILSKGHGSLALYAALNMAGYFDAQSLMMFATPGSRLGGEPSLCIEMGIEASTGSLGHGLSIGTGMALVNKNSKMNSRVFVLLGDGECEEGSVWEAVMAAAKYELNNLFVIIDENRVQKMDTVKNIMGIEGWKNRFEAFGWECREAHGHDVEEITSVLNSMPSGNKPCALIAHTVKGKGISFMEDDPSWHWRMPKRKELKAIMHELNISEEELEKCR